MFTFGMLREGIMCTPYLRLVPGIRGVLLSEEPVIAAVKHS